MSCRPPLALAALAVIGCDANNPRYYPAPTALEVGVPDDGAETTTVTIEPIFRRPTEDERDSLRAQSERAGFAIPWLQRRDVALSLSYTLTNLSNEPARVQLLVDAASELASYDAAALRAALLMGGADPEDVDVPSLFATIPVILAAGEVVSGSVREDDFAEVALDLDAIGRWMAVPAEVLINASEVNPVGLEQVPAAVVVPALVRVQVTLASDRHVRAQLLLRVRNEGQLLGSGDEPFEPRPRAYMPPAP